MTLTVTPFKLDPKELNLPASIPVLEIAVSDYEDWQGNPSWRVDVLLDESATAEGIADGLRAFERTIWDALPGDRFPYFFLATASELAEAAQEAAEEDAA